jgi:RNA polymerase sigma-70 factor (ECF subfamily)
LKVINFQEENELIQLAVENNRQAQQQIFKFSKMLSVCRQYIKDIHQANMITAFMKVFTNLKELQHKGSFEGWIKKNYG